MAGAPAYRDDWYGYAEAQPVPYGHPDISVIPGRGPLPTVSPLVFTGLRVLGAILAILLVAGAVRITVSAAALDATNTYQELSDELTTAHARESALEVQAANLSNPAYVRDYAANKLGMKAPATVETMALGEDVVVVDADGALSLSGSLAAVARR